MKEKDISVFKGHRERMRARLKSRGARFFETYELMEMLLYTVIPRRNTHPTAKLLLKEFGTLDSLFKAKREELAKISGVGGACADFISNVGAFLNFNDENARTGSKKCFSSYEDIGAFFADYFNGKSENETVILLLSSELSYIKLVKIYSLDLSSGAVCAKPFIDAALAAEASVCAIAHNHPHSSPFPTGGDWETGKILSAAFAEAGIHLLENYVVTQEGCKRFSNGTIQSLEKRSSESRDNEAEKSSAFSQYLSRVIEHAVKNREEAFLTVKKIESNFFTKHGLFESNLQKLIDITASKCVSELLVIISELASRKETESFKFGKKHSEEEIKKFLLGYYLNASRETCVILPLDENGYVLGIEALSDGTVNTASIIPRAVLEKLAFYKSQSFILAHNHPGGIAEASREDTEASAKLSESLKLCGVKLSAHYVAANGECQKIDFWEP